MSNRPSKRERREAARRARQRRQRMRWGGLVTALVLGVGGFLAFGGGTSDPVAAIAPDFELQTPAGEPVSLSDYRGSPVALTFMHTD